MKNILTFLTFILLFLQSTTAQTATYWLSDSATTIYGILPDKTTVVDVSNALPYSICDTTNVWAPDNLKGWHYVCRSNRAYEINNLYKYRNAWLRNFEKLRSQIIITQPTRAGSR